MVKLHQLVILTLLFALFTTSIQGQDDFDLDDDPGSAYAESSQTAHWSVYIPITILVVAAIWFGVSDRNHNSSSYSSDSQDALGSIENSKRNPYHRSKSFGPRSYRNSRGSYCH